VEPAHEGMSAYGITYTNYWVAVINKGEDLGLVSPFRKGGVRGICRWLRRCVLTRFHLQSDQPCNKNGRVKLTQQGFHHDHRSRYRVNSRDIPVPQGGERHDTEIVKRIRLSLPGLQIRRRHLKRSWNQEIDQCIGVRTRQA